MIIETSADADLMQRSMARAASRPVARRRLLLVMACWGYLLAVLAVWLVIRQLGDRQWLATVMLLAPRWPYALPLLVLVPWVIAAKRWWLGAVPAAAAGVVLFLILGCRLSLSTAPDRGDLRMFTCNIHRQHVDADALAKFVADLQPDVVALQGWSEKDHEELFGSGRWNVHKEGELLLASRFPIKNVTVVDLTDSVNTPPGERGAAALFELESPRGPMYVMNMHLASPHGGLLTFGGDAGHKLAENIQRRERESGIVQGMTSLAKGPLLLCGDFNTVDDSPMFRAHWGDYTDAFSAKGLGIGYTYMIDHTQIRIDHVLADESWEFQRCWVGPDVGSPHHPLVVDVNYR